MGRAGTAEEWAPRELSSPVYTSLCSWDAQAGLDWPVDGCQRDSTSPQLPGATPAPLCCCFPLFPLPQRQIRVRFWEVNPKQGRNPNVGRKSSLPGMERIFRKAWGGQDRHSHSSSWPRDTPLSRPRFVFIFCISQDLSPWFEGKEKERAHFPKSHRNGSCGLAGLSWERCESSAVSGRLLRERPLAWRAGNINELLMSPAFLSHPHPAQVWAGGCWQHLGHPKKSMRRTKFGGILLWHP